VNAVFVGDRSHWFLVDAGLPYMAKYIIGRAEKRFGKNARPAAIILTHGHFDHVGSLRELADRWDVSVYAHALELPYLTGRSPYPPPDPSVGGGMMARTSFVFSRGPIDISDRVRPLPLDGTIPAMPDWRWIHTPGHSPGHVSFYRERDGALIVGDAFTTQKQESLLAAITEYPQIHGPPMYYTIDWSAARDSVRKLADLDPAYAVTGHGIPMGGRRLRNGLRRLADRFDELALPSDGRYVRQAAITDENGVAFVPPRIFDPMPFVMGAAAIGAAAVLAASIKRKRNKARFSAGRAGR
jgi:glyoxylase-like metal-dependent hydrolase (beta-lactamase superfamily II)